MSIFFGDHGRSAIAEEPPPLARVGTIALKGPVGGLDHKTLDPRRGRLFVANTVNGRLDVVDLKAPKLLNAVGSWDVYPFILNVERSGLPVNAGWMPFGGPPLSEGQALLNDLMGRSVRDRADCRKDVFTSRVALEQLRRDKPRVFYVGLGDTDEYAHGGRYDHYLRAGHQADARLKALWDELQSNPLYRGTLTLIVTTDHDRGEPPQGWKSHGEKVEGSEAI